MPAAVMGDLILATDTHIVLVPTPTGPVPTPTPSPFIGKIMLNVSTNVLINGKPAATVGSMAINMAPHIPIGGTFAKPPTNRGRIILGSPTVLINGKPAARHGDIAMTCNDPVDLPVGTVIGSAVNVVIGP